MRASFTVIGSLLAAARLAAAWLAAARLAAAWLAAGWLAAACTTSSSSTAPPVEPPGAPLSNKVATSAPVHEPFISLERTACYGRCPIYKITVFRDGALEYAGDHFVKVAGKASAQITAAQLDELEQLIQRNHYLELKDSYTDESMTDMPSVETSYAPAGGKPKLIKHYLGDSTAPVELEAVETGIDRIVHIERWVGTRAEREHLRP